MELVFDMVSVPQLPPGLLTSKRFDHTGGTIGRAEGCDWSIPDPSRVLSGRHAEVRFFDGRFYLTDTSINGIALKATGERLAKGQPHPISHGDCYRLGNIEILARVLIAPERLDVGRPLAGDTLIPDDAFLDPLAALQSQDPLIDDDLSLADPASPTGAQQDYARLETESLLVPNLIAERTPDAPAAKNPDNTTTGFWSQFGQQLGLDVESLDTAAREALALRVARLLVQCVDGLQQGLRTRAELKNELRLAQTVVHARGNNPLRHSPEAVDALRQMLGEPSAGQLSAEQAIHRTLCDLQAHQVALVAANHATLRGLLEQLSPEQLAVRFERDGKRLWRTDGARWRAYRRWHQAVMDDERWGEHLLARQFTQAYEDQVRLIATLDSQG